jgi:cell division septation protein DedD
MANFERGVYQPPSDDVRVFDGSEDDEDVEGSRLPLLIVIALFVLAAFSGVVWLAYTQGVQRGRADAPREIVAEPGPARVAPSESADSGTPYRGLKIYAQPAPADEAADEAPVPAQSQSSAQDSPEPTTAGPTVQATSSPRVAAVPPPVELRKTTVPVKPAVAEPAPTVTAKVTPSATVPAPALTRPAPPPPVAASAPSAAGGYVLQIGAYKSEAEAADSWHAYQAKHAALLSGYASDVKRVDLAGKGVWYRLRIGGFADKDVASALCDSLKADGGVCFLAK